MPYRSTCPAALADIFGMMTVAAMAAASGTTTQAAVLSLISRLLARGRPEVQRR